MVDKELLKILACPVCKGDLKEREDKLICSKCKKEYEIKEDIPVLMSEEWDLKKLNAFLEYINLKNIWVQKIMVMENLCRDLYVSDVEK